MVCEFCCWSWFWRFQQGNHYCLSFVSSVYAKNNQIECALVVLLCATECQSVTQCLRTSDCSCWTQSAAFACGSQQVQCSMGLTPTISEIHQNFLPRAKNDSLTTTNFVFQSKNFLSLWVETPDFKPRSAAAWSGVLTNIGQGCRGECVTLPPRLALRGQRGQTSSSKTTTGAT